MTPLDISLPDFSAIQMAARLIAPYIHRTPVLHSQIINQLTHSQLYFKCENFQKAGAFKFRGAVHALLHNLESSGKKPVTTHSSGNHAGALAKAAGILGIECIVVMPENAPRVKIAAVQHYGATIRFCAPTLEARESTTRLVIQETGASLIHPYNNYFIIAGQGTAALELLTNQPSLDIVIAPVGGGGLMSGTALAAKSLNKNIQVYGAEPKGADDAWQSLQAGKIMPQQNPNTIADGLLTSLGDLTFAILSKNLNGIFTVSEKGIVEAMKMIWQYMKIIVEPSSAVTLAAVLEYPDVFRNKKTGIIVSGGNVDFEKLPF
ncbi:MAG: pyridoxal-phosphate dependent enzyme [Bacteroidota bacterium]|nr:MAG: pyridoxal-phosphate dependent enzyme [Bacteroidota bacterium]